MIKERHSCELDLDERLAGCCVCGARHARLTQVARTHNTLHTVVCETFVTQSPNARGARAKHMGVFPKLHPTYPEAQAAGSAAPRGLDARHRLSGWQAVARTATGRVACVCAVYTFWCV